MKKILSTLAICACCYSGIAQLEFRNSNAGRMLNFEDFNGQTLLKKYDADISGTPFLNNEWLPAQILLAKGKTISPITVKFNLESNELYFKDSIGRELVMAEGQVKRIAFINFFTKDSSLYVFKNGYPDIDKQNHQFYYQVLSEGKIDLLFKKSKYISETKDEYTGKTAKEFVDAANVYYIFQNNKIEPVKLNKDAILSRMADKEAKITAYLDATKINFKKLQDIIKLVNYYNSL